MRKTILIVFVLCLSGCDAYYGVVRRANVDYVIDYHCIDSALRQVDDVREIEYKYEEGGIPLTVPGLKIADKLHYFFYKTSDINGYIFLRTNYENKSEISQTYGSLNVIPPQKDINTIRPIMKKIEASIRSICGISNVQMLVNESCSRVKCG
jgi:hypothetical protein